MEHKKSKNAERQDEGKEVKDKLANRVCASTGGDAEDGNSGGSCT